MEIDQMTQEQGDRPQWLGSLVRRGDQLEAATAGEPVIDESDPRWLGSVARRVGEGTLPAPIEAPQRADGEGADWNGSPGRAVVFAASPLPVAPAPVEEPVAAAKVHELPARDRIVMGALGMTLRVAA
jgi:hypothetical protein